MNICNDFFFAKHNEDGASSIKGEYQTVRKTDCSILDSIIPYPRPIFQRSAWKLFSSPKDDGHAINRLTKRGTHFLFDF